MNLLEIRQQFIKLSGREDLATTRDNSPDDYDVDNGADFFIREASTLLDLEQENQVSETFRDFSLAIGDSKIEFTHCRYLKAASFINSDDEEVFLEKSTIANAVSEYTKMDSSDNGTPDLFVPYPVVRPPEKRGLGKAVNYIGVMILPPTDEAVTVRLYGVFHSLKLTENSDENYWSVNYPGVLVTAALRELEGYYRNTTGYNDYDNILQKKLVGIDKDLAAWNAEDGISMEG